VLGIDLAGVARDVVVPSIGGAETGAGDARAAPITTGAYTGAGP